MARPCRDRAQRAPDGTVVLLHHAGGGPTVFRPWADSPGGSAVVAVQLPGRERRFGEPFCDSIGAMAAGAATSIVAAHGSAPVVLVGHSMGGLVAYETAVALRAADVRVALLIITSSFPPDDASVPSGAWSHYDDDALVHELRSLGGPDVWGVEQIRRAFLPIVRADIAACERYHGDPAAPAPRVDAAMLVLSGSEESAVAHRSPEWLRRTTNPTRKVALLDGDHYAVHAHREVVAGIADAALRGAAWADLARGSGRTVGSDTTDG